MIEPFLSVVKCYTHIRSTGSAPLTTLFARWNCASRLRRRRLSRAQQRSFRPGIAPQCSPFSARRWRLAGFWSKQQIHRSSPTADWRVVEFQVGNKYHAPRPCCHALVRVCLGPIVTSQLFCQVAASSRNHCVAWRRRGHLLAHPGADPVWT